MKRILSEKSSKKVSRDSYAGGKMREKITSSKNREISEEEAKSLGKYFLDKYRHAFEELGK